MPRTGCIEPFEAFVRRVAPEHAHLILAEVSRAKRSSGVPVSMLMDAAAVERALGVSRATAWRWRQRPDFPRPLPARSVSVELWDRRDVRAWLAQKNTKRQEGSR